MLLFYHGTDTYRLRQAVEDFVASLRVKHGSSLNIVKIDCADEEDPDALERHVKYPSFPGEHKLIVALQAAGAAMSDVLERYPVAEMADLTVIALQDTSLKQTDKKALTMLKKKAHTTLELSPMSGKELSDWIVNYCKLRETAIATGAIATLTNRVGTDAGLLSLELEKLCAYAQGARIDDDVVHLLTPQRPQRDEWELSNALGAHDKRAAIVALWRKIQEGIPEQMLIGSLAAGLRNLLMIKDLTARKQPPAGIAKLTGLHPFVISKTLRGAASADTRRLTAAHLALARLDRDSKDGLADATDGMFSVVLSL